MEFTGGPTCFLGDRSLVWFRVEKSSAHLL